MLRLLRKGDIISLEKGMKVQIDVLERFVNSEKPYSKKMVNSTIEIGKVYKTFPFSREENSKRMKEIFSEEFGVELSDLTISFIFNYLNIDYEEKIFDASKLEGKYVVSDVIYMGPSENFEGYPYMVKCTKKDDSSILVAFILNEPYVFPNDML